MQPTMPAWYAVDVRITGTSPTVYYRSGKQKGEVKSGGWSGCIYESPTHYYLADIQGITSEAHCVSVVSAPFKRMCEALEDAGYTDVEVHVFTVPFGSNPDIHKQ